MPALELREIHSWFNDPAHPVLPRPAGTNVTAKNLWTVASDLDVEIYSLTPGGSVDSHAHPDHMEMVICWEGSGKVTIAESDGAGGFQAAYPQFAIAQYHSFVVPRGALHHIVADAAGPGMMLLVVHPLVGKPLSEVAGTMPAAGGQLFKWKKNLDPVNPDPNAPIYSFDPDPEHRARRVRIWGRDGELPGGKADVAKEDFHLVAYCFGPGQENPPHFHPRSVELMLGITGRALTYTRDKRWAQGETGWKPERRESNILKGDTALVPLADIHRYINETATHAIVLALQTPQPIMHSLEHEPKF